MICGKHPPRRSSSACWNLCKLDSRPPVNTASPSDIGPRWFSPGVAGIGAASLLSDIGHEIPRSLLPALLTSLGAPAAALGLIEGVANGAAGAAKLLGGPIADDPQRRRTTAISGYATTAILSALIGVAASAWQVGALPLGAWTARGLRIPARNALLADLVPARAYGRAFGFERMMDNLGAIFGPLLALAIACRAIDRLRDPKGTPAQGTHDHSVETRASTDPPRQTRPDLPRNFCVRTWKCSRDSTHFARDATPIVAELLSVLNDTARRPCDRCSVGSTPNIYASPSLNRSRRTRFPISAFPTACAIGGAQISPIAAAPPSLLKPWIVSTCGNEKRTGELPQRKSAARSMTCVIRGLERPYVDPVYVPEQHPGLGREMLDRRRRFAARCRSETRQRATYSLPMRRSGLARQPSVLPHSGTRRSRRAESCKPRRPFARSGLHRDPDRQRFSTQLHIEEIAYRTASSESRERACAGF